MRDFEKSAKLPRVEIIIGHADDDGFLIQTCVNRGVSGIVYAGCGHGSISPKVEEVLSQAAANGCIVVRASRTGAGCVFNGRPDGRMKALFLPALSLRKKLESCCSWLSTGLETMKLQYAAFSEPTD